MARTVTVQWMTGMKASMTAGPHQVVFDAPQEAGGGDEGPSPAEMLLGAIGAGKLSNVRRVAERRQWPLRGLSARLGATEAQGRIVSIDAELILEGALDDAQLAGLREAAESCRISRALSVPVSLRLTVAGDS